MKRLFLLYAPIAALSFLGMALTGNALAQQVVILPSLGNSYPFSFFGSPPPQPGLIQGSDGFFYGMTVASGPTSTGLIYKMSPQGVLTTVHGFDNTNPGDGNTPNSNLVEGSDGNFYGTTTLGGEFSGGTVFMVTPQGQITILYNFEPSYGSGYLGTPQAVLVQGTDGNFYGTTASNSSGSGVIFRITSTGIFTVMHTFGDGSVTNDGANPMAALIQGSDGNFYGTTSTGGAEDQGTVFKMTLQGLVTILHSFKDGSVESDGATPTAALIQSTDGNFYGTTSAGGVAKKGMIFKITPQGTVTIFHSFNDGSVANDGIEPSAGLVQGPDGNFYGMTPYKGRGYGGIIYEITPQAKYTILHSFGDDTVTNDADEPFCSLVVGSDGNLYGTSEYGGPTYASGAIFKVILNLPALTSATQVTGNAGVPFTYQAVASNATTTITATGLPSGLSMDANGLITGSPNFASYSTATVTMTNAFGTNTGQITFNIGAFPVPVVTSMLTAYGVVNTNFSYTITGSNNAYSFSSSTLPSGLQLDSTTGIISGMPAAAGTTPVTITATNSAGTSTSVTLSIQILGAAPTLSQEYVLLHQFNDGSVTSDGQNPSSIFQGFNGSLYGATQAGGTASEGTIFNTTTSGISTVLASLGPPSSATNERTQVGLVQGADGNFYGTAVNVGASAGGIFYQVNSVGQVTVLHHFGDGSVANDGTAPVPGLIQALDGDFYGMTEFGGKANEGCIYKVNPQGSVTILHSFGDGTVSNDGQYPTSGLIQGVDGNFYGMTFAGGSASANAGVVFSMTQPQPQQTPVVTILHSFGDGTVTNDGGQPSAPLVQGDDLNFYGTTQVGGSFDSGCVFKITAQGAVTILHSFGDGTVANDGDTPQSALIEGYDENLYGTTTLGGSAGQGTIFTITKTGTLTILHSFGDGSVTNDGDYPTSICQASDGNFYGTTEAGGYGNGYGTVFAILAGQTPNHKPIFTGAAYAAAPVNAPFSYTPKAVFGVSGSGSTLNGSSVKAKAGSLLPQAIHPSFTGTNWMLSEQGVGAVPPNTLLPLNLTFDPSSGTISGTPLQSGTYTLSMTPNNAKGAGTAVTVTLYIDVPPQITSLGTAGGNKLTLFGYDITAQALPTSFGATGLPNWLSIDTASGQITGTPPDGGTFVFNAIAENYAGTGVLPVILTVTGGSPGAPSINSPTTFNGTAGTFLTYPITATQGPTSFSALMLPVGLSCNANTGIISGIPTTAGTYSVPISATNSSGTTDSEVTFTISQAGAPVIANSLTAQAYSNTYFSYPIPVSGPVSVYSQIGLPSGLSLDPLSGIISGTPTSNGMTSVQLFAVNGSGSTSTTLNLSVSPPAPVPYGEWDTLYGAAPAGGPTGSPYNDGITNLLKYITNTNPDQPLSATDRSALPTVVVDNTSSPGTTYLAVTYRQYKFETANIQLQTSTDLQNWTTVTSPDIDTVIGYDVNTSDPIVEIGVIVNPSVKEFVRLNITN